MKDYKIIDIILRRPVTVVMLSLMVIGFGLFALANLKVTLYPSLDIPVVAVSTSYRNVSPEDMSTLIVEPIEAAIASLEGVDEIESNVRKGSAFIRMRLKDGANAREVEMDAREAIDRIRNSLPREAAPPVIFQFDPENFPVMRLSVEASNRGLDELRNLSMDLVEPLLERINGVASADTRGGIERTIYVELDPLLVAQNRLTIAQIENAIRQNNVQVPLGNLVVNRSSYSIRAQSVYTSVDEIAQTVITTRQDGQTPIRISDVALVKDSFVDVTTVEEVNGKNSVTVEVQKQSDANTLDVTNGVLEALPDILDRLPPGVSINVLSNEGTDIDRSISNLAQSAVFALVLVILILILFLGGWRSSSVVALSIPISMTATFAAMYFMGLTLNFVSITGLALAVGLLVDSSIVVLESIVGKLEDGKSLFKAASEGTKEVIGALWGSTLTTLVVFLPFLFISGMTSVFMKDLAITISLAIGFSFLASFILVPVFASRLLPLGGFKKVSLSSQVFTRMERYYGRSLQWAVTHKLIMFVLIGGVFYGTWFFNSSIESIFLPSSDAGQINVNVDLPAGTSLVQTGTAIKQIADELAQEPYVQTIVTSIGTSGWRSESNTGRISLTLVAPDEREQTSDQIAMQLRRRFDLAGVRVSIFATGGSGFRFGGRGGWGGIGNNIRVTLIGPETETLVGIANRIEEVMLQDTLVVSVDNPRTSGVPELHYLVDRQRVSRAGSSLSEVANSFKTQARGTQVGFFRDGGREVPIEVRNLEQYRQSLSDMEQIQVLQIGDQRVPLENLGRFEAVEAVNRITRRDREVIMDVNISVNGNANAQRERIIELFENDIVLPDGYRYEFAGTNQDTQQGQSDIFIALLFGLILTYMVMASKFENFRDPFVIMFSIPLAFFGSYLMLWLTGTPWSVPAGLGMIILVGIVINNGIVMVDYIHQYCKREEDANNYVHNLIAAARRRMRPILLTALTTIGSMIPLALELGAGSETWSPLALTVIGGLTFSAVFTLYVIPVVLISISAKRRRAAKEFKIHLRSMA